MFGNKKKVENGRQLWRIIKNEVLYIKVKIFLIFK